jgi:hypothetical protein
MRSWLPLCFVCFTAAIIAAPVQAQYIYLDVDGDQKCTYTDLPPYEEGAIDVWLDTAHEAAGGPATCATGEELTISAYEVVIRAEGLAITGWANARPEFPQSLGYLQEGNAVRVAYTSSGGTTHLPPGSYKLGTISTIPAQGCPYIRVVGSAFFSARQYTTGFYSQCAGPRGDYTVRFGEDFFDDCAVGGICDGAEEKGATTWGKIKQQYLGK